MYIWSKISVKKHGHRYLIILLLMNTILSYIICMRFPRLYSKGVDYLHYLYIQCVRTKII